MRKSNRPRKRATKSNHLNLLRQFYAEELRAVANLRSEAVVKAFAKVPREHFLGPGPRQILSPGFESYWTTEDVDPRHVYHNVLVAIDASRNLNNGHPSFLAFLIDSLQLREGEHVAHVGCGTGYYTAILAEVVGPNGHVTAVEITPILATLARSNLSYLSQVEVVEADGCKHDPGPSDAILINAGVTHSLSVWLDSLRPGGRLIVPITVSTDTGIGTEGKVLKIHRETQCFAARFISEVGIFRCIGARDPELNRRLKEAFSQEGWKSVQSLRRDKHDPTDTCWLHAESFCLSKVPVTDPNVLLLEGE